MGEERRTSCKGMNANNDKNTKKAKIDIVNKGSRREAPAMKCK